jgi:hypothetical protein
MDKWGISVEPAARGAFERCQSVSGYRYMPKRGLRPTPIRKDFGEIFRRKEFAGR